MDSEDTEQQAKPFYQLTFGSFNRNDSRVATLKSPKGYDFTVGQSHCITIVAWMYHFKYKPCEWNGSHMDNIICKGDWLNYLWLSANTEDLSKDVLFNIKTGCVFSKVGFQYEPLSKLSFFGKFTGLRGKLKKYMLSCDDTSRSILFTCKQMSFGIFGYIGTDGVVEYCLFDPHGRNSEGYFDYTQHSSISCFKTIDDVVALLARDEIFAHCRYTCLPIKKKPVVGSDRLIIVKLHNSQRFVDEYLSGDGWYESSGSSDDDSEPDETDDDSEHAFSATDVGDIGATTASGRTVKAPRQYTADLHPSFFRGKLREDMKRSEGKWKRWYDAKTPEQKENFKRRKNRRYAFKKLYQF